MARKRLTSGGRFKKAPKLTREQIQILRKYGTSARALAKKFKEETRKAKEELLKKDEIRPTLSTGKKKHLAKVTMLNTWLKEESKQRARMEVQFIPKGKNAGKFKDLKSGKIVTRQTVQKRHAMLQYHATVKHMHKVLGGSYAEARKAYKAFQTANLLRVFEIKYD